MLRHPTYLCLDQYNGTKEPSSRLSSLLLAFEYLLRIDGLLLASTLLESNQYGDSSVWNLVLKNHLTLGEWRTLLKETANVVRQRAAQAILRWFKAVDQDGGPLASLLELRNQRAHAGDRANLDFEEKLLARADPLFNRCLSDHPDVSELHESKGGRIELRQDNYMLTGGPFLLTGTDGNNNGIVLVFCGRRRKTLTYDSFQGVKHSSEDAFRNLTESLRKITTPMEYIGALFPREILYGRLLDHTARTVARLCAQRRYRPESSINRVELDEKLASFMRSTKRLLLLEGSAGSGKSTWLCQVAEARKDSSGVLLETADRLSADNLPEWLGTTLRVRGNFTSALEDLAPYSADRRILILIDALEVAGLEERHLLDLFHWVERLPSTTSIRVVATIRSERLQRFRGERELGIPQHVVEISSVPPLSDSSLIELAERLPVFGDHERDRIISIRVELARKLALLAYDSARLPGLASTILEAAVRNYPAGAYSAQKIHELHFRHLIGENNGRAIQPLRGRILRTLASALLTQAAYQIAIEDKALDPLSLIDLATGQRSNDYQALLAVSVLAETVEEFMPYVAFSDLGFYEYVASLVLPLMNVESLLSDLCAKSQHYPLAISVAAFLLIRAMHANGTLATLDAIRTLGEAKEILLLELARLEGESFLELLGCIVQTEPEQALSLASMLIRVGEPRLAERAAERLISQASLSLVTVNRARLIRAQAFYEIDDHRSAENELEQIAGEVTYEALALGAEIAIVRGKLTVAYESYEALIQRTTGGPTDKKADALAGLGYVLGRMGKYREAKLRLQEAIELLEPNGASSFLAEALGDLGQIMMELGELEQAGRLLRKNLLLCQELGDLIGEGVAEGLIAELCVREGSLGEAERRFRRALNVARWVCNRWREAWILKRFGRLCQSLGKVDEANTYFCEGEKILERIGGVDNE